jgi:PAS domain-containing protein
MSGLDVSDSALLATLLREAPIGFAFFGTDLRFRRINRSLARLSGRNGSDHLGLLPSEVWPEPVAGPAEAAIRHVLSGDQPLMLADQQVSVASPAGGSAPGPAGTSGPVNGAATRDGSGPAAAAAQPQVRHWAFSWFPSHDPDGDVSGVALIAVDVTDRRNSEEAVRRSEERYRSLVQAGAQVVWVATPAGEIAEDSPEWRWITGQELEEYLGSVSASARSAFRTRPMPAAAVSPLPITSPAATASRPSGSRNASYQSPPISMFLVTGRYRASSTIPGTLGS